ncbi:hypothetical protein ACLSU7_07735 [Bdellovibrio sp. HCB185ZH]|uniref:hypothetical protein n=1 Tax=Bdellovibrio sp. HCB185ZH TaxID=3394235 RepID=UPI0039A739A3
MKAVLIAIAMVLGITTTAQAGEFARQTIHPADNSPVEALQNLFAKEVKKEGSPLNKYMKTLKEIDPSYFYDDTISAEDVVRLESGGNGGIYSINYLIIIRAGYKSNTFQMGYLKAEMFGHEEGETFTVVISEPAKVTIE